MPGKTEPVTGLNGMTGEISCVFGPARLSCSKVYSYKPMIDYVVVNKNRV